MRKQPHFLRRFAVTAAVALALCAGVSAQAASLVPLGRAVGIQMTTAGMLVADLAEVDTPGGKATPAKDAGLLPGDVICRIDGRDIASSADFLAAMDAAGDTMSVTVLRGGAEVTATVTPAVTADGTRQIGLWLRDGVTGVGTLTYYDPATGRYGALGHGISDEASGVLMPLRDGSVLSAVIADARPGGHGTAGELVGSFDPGNRIGGIERNCLFGVFGTPGRAAGRRRGRDGMPSRPRRRPAARPGVPKTPNRPVRSMPPMRLPGSKLPTSSPAVPWPPGRASAMTAESTLPSRSGMSTPLASSEMPWPSAP